MNNPKLIVIYYGRFQPPHMGHIGVYHNIAATFGSSNVYIGTSDIQDAERSPLSFQWKQKLLKTMGVPANRIIKTRATYKSEEVQHALGVDPKNSVFIVAVGEKDETRLKGGKYYEKYKKGMKLKPMTEKGYYYIIPNIKMGGKVMSATDIRKVLRKNELTTKDYDYLRKAMGIGRAQADNLKPLFEHRVPLQEGGYAGHMTNMFEDPHLTFSDFENIIKASLNGEINREEISEKVDGQNLFASVKNGRVILARNKTQIKNKGESALTVEKISELFKDKPSVKKAFLTAMSGLESSIFQLSKKDVSEIFDNGRNWINIEILAPSNKNVFLYDTKDMIVFHNLQIVGDDGNSAGISADLQKKLFSKIRNIKQGEVAVHPPVMMSVRPHEDFSAKSKYFIGKLNKFRAQQKLGPSATLGQWFESYFNKKLSSIEGNLKTKIKPKVRSRIIQRFAYNDSSISMAEVKKELEDAYLYGEIAKIASNIDDEYKIAREPLELLLMELGVEVLSNLETYMSANPDHTIATLRKDIATKIKQIRASKNVDDIQKMRELLQKIESIGGLQKVVPTEGIVFSWNGKTYKMTGSFAPLGRLLGMGRYGR